MPPRCVQATCALCASLMTGCPPAPQTGDQNVDPQTTGILITVPAGAAIENFDLYTADGATRLSRAHDVGATLAVEPGAYRLTQYFNETFVYAASVVVVAGATTVVPFGGIRVTTVNGSEPATYDIYDATGDTLLDRPNDADVIVPVPPGTYRLRQYFNADFDFAENVVVAAGQVATVPLGALHVEIPPGAEPATYDIYAADGSSLLARPNSDSVLVPVPPGEYVLKEYFNDAFVYAREVVTAGQARTIRLGAIRYTGSEPSYDIYDAGGATLLVRPASAGDIRPVPPGTYVLKDYFADDVLAAAVTVTAGETTEAP